MKRRRRVALIIETSNEYARGILHGIRSYVREHESWSLFLGERSRGEPPTTLGRWQGDGIIARIENDRIAKIVERAGLPTVDVSAARRIPELPWVETDNEAIARSAVDHLVERGYQNFGFCGVPAFQWSREREEWFARFVRQHHYECSVFPPQGGRDATHSPAEQEQAIEQWVMSLPKPVGIMAAYDNRALQLIDACRNLNVAVPEQVAVIGVDNDELLCDLCDPPLSSIILDTDGTGYKAAELLDQMMAGQEMPGDAYLFKPLGIVSRASTDALAMVDPDVVRAVQFIRQHACDGISVSDVLEQIPMSRRVFEHRFREQVGRSPHQQIMQIRIDRVKEMLIGTDLSLATVAARCGFKHQEYMSVVFKKHVDESPSVYRDTHRVD